MGCGASKGQKMGEVVKMKGRCGRWEKKAKKDGRGAEDEKGFVGLARKKIGNEGEGNANGPKGKWGTRKMGKKGGWRRRKRTNEEDGEEGKW